MNFWFQSRSPIKESGMLDAPKSSPRVSETRSHFGRSNHHQQTINNKQRRTTTNENGGNNINHDHKQTTKRPPTNQPNQTNQTKPSSIQFSPTFPPDLPPVPSLPRGTKIKEMGKAGPRPCAKSHPQGSVSVGSVKIWYRIPSHWVSVRMDGRTQ